MPASLAGLPAWAGPVERLGWMIAVISPANRRHAQAAFAGSKGESLPWLPCSANPKMMLVSAAMKIKDLVNTK